MAIDTGKTKDTLFGNISKREAREGTAKAPPPVIALPHASQATTAPKYQTFDKVTTLLTPEQKEGLDRVAKRIMKHRANELKKQDNRERITANTLIRALVQAFLDNEGAAQIEALADEEAVHTWVRKVLKA
jgi:mannitol/fructose-specific phosphotransferase system IIA component (Ntr-type)